MEDRLLITIPEVAARLGIGRSLVYTCLRDQSLVSVKIGRARRIPCYALDDFIEKLAQEQGGASPSPLAGGSSVHVPAPSSTMQPHPGDAPRSKVTGTGAHLPDTAARRHQQRRARTGSTHLP